MSVHHNFIGGEKSSGVSTIDNINPSDTNDIVGRFARASAADAEDAIAAALAASHDWARSGIQMRHDILKKAADEIMARKEALKF